MVYCDIIDVPLENVDSVYCLVCTLIKIKFKTHFRFDEKENVSNCIQLKTSVIKGIKNQLLDQFPDIEAWLNHIMPKKDPVKIVRWYGAFYTSAGCSLWWLLVI